LKNQGSIVTLARKTLTIINTHHMTPQSFGAVEVYLEKFKSALLELEEIEKPYIWLRRKSIS